MMTNKATLPGEPEKLIELSKNTEPSSVEQAHGHHVPFAQTLRPGMVVQGRYMLKKKLGVGGFAIVYLAHDAQIDRDLAIKFLNIQGIEDNPQKREEFTARFEREAKLAARVRHSAVMEVYEYGLANNGTAPYIAMEYLKGHDLEEHLERFGPMEPEQFLKLFIPCIEALGFAHNEGIIHKDLKPSNLFIKYPGERRESMTIVDFGVAHIQAQYSKRLTQTGNLFATPSYIAPEYAQSQTVCPPLDIYQMGLILVEGLTGKTVVDVDDFMLAIIQHAQGQLQIPKYLLESPLGPILRKSMALDYNDRYQNGFEFADALKQIDPLSIPPKPASMQLVALNNDVVAYRVPVPTPHPQKDSITTLTSDELPTDFLNTTVKDAPQIPVHRGHVDPTQQRTAPQTKETLVDIEAPETQPKNNRTLLVGVVLLFIGIAILGGSIVLLLDQKDRGEVKQDQPTTKAPTAPKITKRDITITSEQPNVKVFEGDTLLGTTPLTLKRQTGDQPLNLVAKLGGHQDYALTIPLDQTQAYQKAIAMVPITKDQNKAQPKDDEVKPTTKKTKPVRKVKPVKTKPTKKPDKDPKEVKVAPKTTAPKTSAPKTTPKDKPSQPAKPSKPKVLLPE